jgi:hypothetical protein
MRLPKEQVERINYWVAFFRAEYEGEVPMQIHAKVGGSDEGGGLGGPPFHPRFISWLTAQMEKPNNRGLYSGQHGHNRVTKVLRLIREVSPTEYFVLQRIVNDHLTIEQTVNVMNARSEERGLDETWDYGTVLALLMAGIDKMSKWY